jgi:Asp-tRNA(Asn)/Glu-tRNA(Gln) amidotransferase A subunit family amidase
MMELAYASAVELAQGLREKKYGSRELLEMYLQRVERLDGKINAVVVNGRIALQGGERRDTGRHSGTPIRPVRS